ncbi:hypothetical protein OYT1_ch1726 [Ferriphaselus amnicola]|uniref:Uncharacterized protein n=1 Tax=Ferriphaselus amnicola TaxID=1188319 RepID=A0A2Z6GD14_9PROT|nr:hypothetical protein [Ferriphaselus amnicola]BBE51264.1 hypothetical protein OYT1_ch1726 [Ferriphaselus amnicola]
MPILSEALTSWEIAFRWAGYDPDRYWFNIPMAVRDNLRLLAEEIHHGRLDCVSLEYSKYHGDDPEEAKLHIYYWLREITDCYWGKRFDRKLLKWAVIERQAMQEWCERHKVPLPEFWFPSGWGIEYEWQENFAPTSAATSSDTFEPEPPHPPKNLDYYRCKYACQQISLALWRDAPKSTIKDVANTPEVQNLGGGSSYDFETVCAWLGEVDPRDPSQKRGRRRKNNSPPT